ncbi:MAG: ATPase domain-containing protein [Candidatus Methanoperedens sp.]|nr:ATPase domain-containing protein [Candidatus Methanoperedens sp.]
MREKHPIHTTLSTDAMRILERYEKELGTKNTVLERALLGMDKLRFKDKIDTQSIIRIIRRIKTGIPGFDGLIEGGIPEGFVVVVTGPPGTGKTTFSLQFLLEGVKNNERCIFFSFEENAEQLINQSIRFGWDFGEYVDKGYLEIFGFSRFSTEEITEIIDIFKPKRIVFDSLNIFSDITDFRRSPQWRNILKVIKDKKITCLAVTEKSHGGSANEFDEFDFMGDGVISFDKKQKNEFDTYPTCNIQIQKMRLTKLNEIAHQFVIKENGIELIGNMGIERKAFNTLHANRAKIERITTIDRELRISLNSIIGFSELMIVKAPGDLNEKQERYVQNVHASGKHLLELIQKRS